MKFIDFNNSWHCLTGSAVCSFLAATLVDNGVTSVVGIVTVGWLLIGTCFFLGGAMANALNH